MHPKHCTSEIEALGTIILHTTEVRPLPGCRLFLCFNNGAAGEVDLSAELEGEVFEALRVSDADDLAYYLAKDLANVCNNLAGLMDADADGNSSGYLQGAEDIPRLICIFGSSFDTLAALTELSGKANERRFSLMGLYVPKTYERMEQHAKRQEVNP